MTSTIADLLAEQSGEGPGNGGITRSVFPLFTTSEQSGKGPGNGGITRSVTGGKGVKRKKEVKTIEEKFAAITECEKGLKTKSEIARALNIPQSTLSTWLKQKDSIKAGYQKFGPKRKMMKTGSNEDLEEALVTWFRQTRSNNVPVSGPMLQTKAEELANKMSIPDFKASSGWLDRFKERHGILFKKICGEANSVDTESAAMSSWQDRLRLILDKYEPDQIYNADETGIFYKLLPDKKMEFKNVQCHGVKQSKQRLTALVCANMTGSVKWPLLILGKSAKPRCFKNVKTLPTKYQANKKAWMTSEIFEKWVSDFDSTMERKGKKAALIIDNCPAHPNVKGLKATELIFLPPNTTSKTQPMDQGVIQSLKCRYRKRVLYKTIRAIDANREVKISAYDAMEMLRQAWNEVLTATIINCFRKAEFTVPVSSEDSYESDEDPDDDIPLARLQTLGLTQTTVRDFLQLDDNLPICMEISDDTIIESVLTNKQQQDEEEEEDDDADDTLMRPIPTTEELLSACDLLQHYLRTQENTSDELRSVSLISDRVVKDDMRKCTKQSVITSFFQRKVTVKDVNNRSIPFVLKNVLLSSIELC